jgi:hypothetical protein
MLRVSGKPYPTRVAVRESESVHEAGVVFGVAASRSIY